MKPNRRQRGSVALELLALAPIVLLVGLTVLQAVMTVASATSAQNAARSASRAAAAGRADPVAAGRISLPSWLRPGSEVVVTGTVSRVRVRVPLIVPGLSSSAITVARDAEMPRTG